MVAEPKASVITIVSPQSLLGKWFQVVGVLDLIRRISLWGKVAKAIIGDIRAVAIARINRGVASASKSMSFRRTEGLALEKYSTRSDLAQRNSRERLPIGIGRPDKCRLKTVVVDPCDRSNQAAGIIVDRGITGIERWAAPEIILMDLNGNA
jgi:hypothetical protein